MKNLDKIVELDPCREIKIYCKIRKQYSFKFNKHNKIIKIKKEQEIIFEQIFTNLYYELIKKER